MADSLVTVATYWNVGDAEVAKNALDAAGIESFLDDENMVRINWLNANAVHGVKLRVRDEDADRAGEVLREPSTATGEEEDEELVPPPGPLVCGECGSANVFRRPRGLYFVVIAALAVAVGVAVNQTEAAFFIVVAAGVFALISNRWLCTDCGETWN